jgi:nucleotide-binding universal stress UspA family protein
MIKTILFATDLGVHTPYLLHHVNALAAEHGLSVIVLHVIEPPGHMGEAVVKSYLSEETRLELEEEGIQRIISGVKNRLVDVLEDEYIDGNKGLSEIHDVRVVTGKPADIILQHSEQCSADMLVLGSHGQGSCVPNMLGSVAFKVLQQSRVPVFMVPLMRNSRDYARAV